MERTLAILKPDCTRRNLIGRVIERIEGAGFRILAIQMVQLNPKTAGEFYAIHRGRPFYKELVEFMSSGSVVPIAIEKENAVADFRTLIGATDPAEADPGTIRKDFAESKGKNIVHGSDSVENAEIEIGFFFSSRQLAETL